MASMSGRHNLHEIVPFHLYNAVCPGCFLRYKKAGSDCYKWVEVLRCSKCELKKKKDGLHKNADKTVLRPEYKD